MWVSRRLVQPGCNGRSDHGRAAPVADLVLHDQYRAHAALLRPHHRRKICVKTSPQVPPWNLLPSLEDAPRLCDASGASSSALSILCSAGDIPLYAQRLTEFPVQKASAMPPSWLREPGGKAMGLHPFRRPAGKMIGRCTAFQPDQPRSHTGERLPQTVPAAFKRLPWRQSWLRRWQAGGRRCARRAVVRQGSAQHVHRRTPSG